MRPIRHILVPTDFSLTANNALVYALDLAQEAEANVFILHLSNTGKLVLCHIA